MSSVVSSQLVPTSSLSLTAGGASASAAPAPFGASGVGAFHAAGGAAGGVTIPGLIQDRSTKEFKKVADILSHSRDKDEKKDLRPLDLLTGVNATERVSRVGKSSKYKHRVVCLCEKADAHGTANFLAVLKKHKDKLEFRKCYPLREGLLVPDESHNESVLRLMKADDVDEDDAKEFTVDLAPSRAFLGQIDRCLRTVAAAGRERPSAHRTALQMQDEADDSSSSESEEKKKKVIMLLSAKDDEILGAYIAATEGAMEGQGVDAAQLRDGVNRQILRQAWETAIGIEQGEEGGRRIGDDLIQMVLKVTQLQVSLREYDNKLINLRDMIVKKVEKERNKKEIHRVSNRKLHDVLARVTQRMEMADQHIQCMKEADFSRTDDQEALRRAMQWKNEIERDGFEREFPIAGVRDKMKEIGAATAAMTERLHAYLAGSRKGAASPGGALAAEHADAAAPPDAAAKQRAKDIGDFAARGRELLGDRTRLAKKERLRWRSHDSALNRTGSLHQRWGALSPLMPAVLGRGVRRRVELQRAYENAMQKAYAEEVREYFSEVRRELVMFKVKPGFLIGHSSHGAGKDGMELMSEQNQRDGGGGLSVYSASRAGGSHAGSSYGGCSSDGGGTTACSLDGKGDRPDVPEASELQKLELWPFKGGTGVGVVGRQSSMCLSPSPGHGSEMGGADVGSDPGHPGWDGASRASGDDAMSGYGAASAYGAERKGRADKLKGRLRVEIGITNAIIQMIDVVLKEQTFLREFFGPDPDELQQMLTNLFTTTDSECRRSGNLLDHELRETLRYVERRCDKSYIIPVQMLVRHLQDSAALRQASPFLTGKDGVLTNAASQIHDILGMWRTQQFHSIDKCKPPGGVKHCLLLPCFSRFRIFFARLARLCQPLVHSCALDDVEELMQTIVREMCQRLDKVSLQDSKYADFFELKNLSCLCRFLEEQRPIGSPGQAHVLRGTETAAKLVDCLELKDLQRSRDNKRDAYIQRALLQDSFRHLFEFIEWADAFLRTHEPHQLQYQAQYSNKAVAHLLSDHAKKKHVAKTLATIYQRQTKHFFEHTAQALHDEFMQQLFHDTWQATRTYILSKWRRLEEILKQCYQRADEKLDCRRDYLTAMLEKAEGIAGDT